ncbi:MAG: hypothetical protein JWL96_709 [Sphingomonas bacterium]|uniref:hypothetical protein n=1 Tax=Sphingomonas bacterium TaxID=1895847 RepID=UPI00260ACF80|nr:hypothetical protein [Sphingomonas bacterium]MDB5708639.1 hypothetical protein [Sphingomonas bacterium]
MIERRMTEEDMSPRPAWLSSLPGATRIVLAVPAGATVATLVAAPLLGLRSFDGAILPIICVIWIYQAIGILVVLPVWELLYRFGCRRWVQASLFGAVTAFVAALWLFGGSSTMALRFAMIPALSSAVGGLVIWWIAYRPRASITPDIIIRP